MNTFADGVGRSLRSERLLRIICAIVAERLFGETSMGKLLILCAVALMLVGCPSHSFKDPEIYKDRDVHKGGGCCMLFGCGRCHVEELKCNTHLKDIRH